MIFPAPVFFVVPPVLLLVVTVAEVVAADSIDFQPPNVIVGPVNSFIPCFSTLCISWDGMKDQKASLAT